MMIRGLILQENGFEIKEILLFIKDDGIIECLFRHLNLFWAVCGFLVIRLN